jgi:hypothetical protein
VYYNNSEWLEKNLQDKKNWLKEQVTEKDEMAKKLKMQVETAVKEKEDLVKQLKKESEQGVHDKKAWFQTQIKVNLQRELFSR